jgi:tape measure domain-containing protein
MAGEKLSWYFELVDRFTPSSNRILASVNRLTKGMGAGASGPISRAIGGIQSAFARLGAGVRSVAGVLTSLPAILGGAALTGLAVIGGKFALDSLSFKENSLAAFRSMLGTQAAADRVFQQAVDFAAKTPFDTKEVVSSFQQLLTAGFKLEELDTVMSAIGDVGAARGVEKMESVQRAMGKIMAKGRLQGEELMMLSEAGVGQGAVFEALAKTLGKTTDEVQKLITAGKISSKVAIGGVLEAINQTIDGGRGLGKFMADQANTLTGVLSTLGSRASDLLFAANASSVMDPLKAAVVKFTDLLNPDSPTGKRIVAFIERIGNAFGRMFGGVAGGNALENMLNGVMSILEGLADMAGIFFDAFVPAFKEALGPANAIFGAMGGGQSIVQTLTPLLQLLGKALGTAAGWIVDLAAMFGGANVTVLKFASTLSSFLLPVLDALFIEAANHAFTWGANVVTGFANGILSKLPSLSGVAASLGQTVANGVKGSLGIQSPSRVMMGLGMDTGEGFAIGLEQSNMQGALSASMPLGPTLGGAAFAASAGSSTVTTQAPVFNLQVDAKGATKEDAQAMAQTIKQVLLSQMTGAFEQMAIEVGA